MAVLYFGGVRVETFTGAVLKRVEAVEAELRAAHSMTEARLKGIEQSQSEIMEALRELMQPRPGPLYMSVAQVAKRYGVSDYTIYGIVRMPESPTTLKVGAKRLLPIKDYDAFMGEQFTDET